MIKRLFKRKKVETIKSNNFNIATSKYEVNPITGKTERIECPSGGMVKTRMS